MLSFIEMGRTGRAAKREPNDPPMLERKPKPKPRLRGVKLLNNLQMTRVVLGISQEELAKLAGVSIKTISDIENYKSRPSVDLAMVIALVLDTSVEALFSLH